MIRPGSGLSLANGARAFRHRNYRLYFGGQLVSLVGTWMQAVAQGWLILQLTGDAFLLGVVAAMQWIPVMVLGLFGGLITDTLPKRRTLIVTQAVKMALGFAMFGLVFTNVIEVWQVMVLAFLGGLTNVVDMPTRQAFAVEMVGREDIGNAVALNSAMFNAARVLGPAVAGLTIGAFDLSTAFLIDGISFLAVLLALVAMRDSELRTVPPIARPQSVDEVFEGLREGLSYVRRTPLVLLGILVVGLVATFGMNFQVVIPPLTEQVLHSDATGYGFLMAASGLGSLIAALFIAFSPRSRVGLIAGGALLVGAAEIALGVSQLFFVSLVLMFLVGMGAIAMAATANTTIQLTVPDHLRGRTMSVYTTVFAGSTPVGGLLMGYIASRFGIAESMVLGGIACAVIGAGAFAWIRHSHAAMVVEGRPEHQPVRATPAPATGAAPEAAGASPIPGRAGR